MGTNSGGCALSNSAHLYACPVLFASRTPLQPLGIPSLEALGGTGWG
ncbi:hypothetical protein A176_004556 [Myxococcus hansupus]|uniref:Uncharacterized protein n=1 Tax=Pseudomyxococcus hansupus TaxID=1297742 RepID=A0A0H4WXV8_9BACT|nr:hypothetical protein A176_004556 [Myxococcus hansupus]